MWPKLDAISLSKILPKSVRNKISDVGLQGLKISHTKQLKTLNLGIFFIISVEILSAAKGLSY